MNTQGDGSVGLTETALTHVNGFTSTPYAFYVANSPFVEGIAVEISETRCLLTSDSSWEWTGSVIFAQNSAAVNISLPNLASTGGQLVLGNCSALSIPALNRVNGTFNMINATFKHLEAPNLGLINGSLNITGSFSG